MEGWRDGGMEGWNIENPTRETRVVPSMCSPPTGFPIFDILPSPCARY